MLTFIVEHDNDLILSDWDVQTWLVGGACDSCMRLVSVKYHVAGKHCAGHDYYHVICLS